MAPASGLPAAGCQEEARTRGSLPAEALALEHAATRRPGRRAGFDPLVRDLARDLATIYARLSDPGGLLQRDSRAVEWLVDNEYVLRASLDHARHALTRGFYRDLPKLVSDEERESAGEPRVLDLARTLLRGLDDQLRIDACEEFLDRYQETRNLAIGELWALPAVLSLAVLEMIVSEVQRALSGDAASEGIGPHWPTIANCVGSLRLIEAYDWREFVERVSRVERSLRTDPSGHYEQMDFATRDAYRRAVEEIARYANLEEISVADSALRMAGAQAVGVTSRRRHVGHYLVGDGRGALEAHLGACPRGWAARERWIRRHVGWFYFGGIALLAGLCLVGLALFTIRAAGTWPTVFVLVTAWVPGLTIAGSAASWLVAQLVTPKPLPKLELRDRVPAGLETVVALPVLIQDEADVEHLLERLEILHESSGLADLRFVLLSDLYDAPDEHMPGDAALIERANLGIRDLNQRHAGSTGPAFGLLHRPRRFNDGESCWMGWERKRGKLEEFNRLVLGGGEEAFTVREGCAEDLSGTRFVITLDADTGLPRGTADRLIGALAHPLNAPLVREDGSTDGYTILQPRVETLSDPAASTWFSRLGGAGSGLDLYSHAISDVYQDLFGEGIYAGKGIYDVAAFDSALKGRVPENALLSHDLFEGVHGRVGLLSDTVLLEELPTQLLGYTRRMHRWIRGDWQIAPWLLPRVPLADGRTGRNLLSWAARWKIFDNLRRSLLAPSLATLIVGGWWLHVGHPAVWPILAAVVIAFPVFLGAATATRRFFREARGEGLRAGLRRPTRGSWIGLGERLGQVGLALVLLPYEGLLAADAIGRTLWRLGVSHRHLLQWTSAAATKKMLGAARRWKQYWAEMAGAPIFTLALATPALLSSGGTPIGWALVTGWLLCPQIGYWISRPMHLRAAAISTGDERFLRLLALRTWLYFERFVTAEDHWLPPDNWQESRDQRLARRTSPTNIGMLFTSMVAAYDLGHLTGTNLEAGARDSLLSMARLERYRGHLLNWYSTEDLSPLEPRYVSTVDSGNLAAGLLVLGRTLDEAASTPPLRAVESAGMSDLFEVLEQTVRAMPGLLSEEAASLRRALRQGARVAKGMPAEPRGRHQVLKTLEEDVLPEVDRRSIAVAEEPDLPTSVIAGLREWSVKLHQQTRMLRRELEVHAPWLPTLLEMPNRVATARAGSDLERHERRLEVLMKQPPAPTEAAAWCRRARQICTDLEGADRGRDEDLESRDGVGEWCARLRDEIDAARDAAEALVSDLSELSGHVEHLVEETDFSFLFDSGRKLLRIGYNVTDEEPDPHYYDVLASEARVASYIAIAKGDVPVSHWLHLGRSFTVIGHSPVLLSWGATMFEYLLPDLFLEAPRDSLLGHSSRQAVRGQIRFGRQYHTPWGISESAYERVGDDPSYQYRAFGVPGLGLRRDVGERHVVAPYASALALRADPVEAVRNLEQLSEQGLSGPYGLYEAVDYGPAGARHARHRKIIVRAFMAHHQGMILGAIDNLLNRDILVKRLRRDPQIAAIEYLLHERLPWRVPFQKTWERKGREDARAIEAGASTQERLASWTPIGDARVPQIHALGNGHYRVVLTARGGGGSLWEDIALTRWRPDSTLETHGTWTYVVDRESGAVWSATAAPSGDPHQSGSAQFAPHQAEFHEHHHWISTRLRIGVAPDADVEIRHLTITNEGDRARRLDVFTYAEVILASPEDDVRHPAYTELFLEGRYLEEPGCLLYHRRRRSSEERSLYWAHSLVGGARFNLPEARILDRETFVGRGGTSRDPMALGRPDEPDTGSGASLHPCAALGMQVELPPYATRELIAITTAGESREKVLDTVDAYRLPSRALTAFERAAQAAEIELAGANLMPDDIRDYERLLSAALHPTHGLRSGIEERRAGAGPQSELWRFGLSGDLPIVLLRVHDPEAADIARCLLRAHAFWRHRGFRIDLVILDLASSGYAQPLRDVLAVEIEQTEAVSWLGRNGGVHILGGDMAATDGSPALEAAAATLLDSRHGSLAHQLGRLERSPSPMPEFVPVRGTDRREDSTPRLERAEGLLYDNGRGGFSPDGSEYVIRLEPGEHTPAPWSNVIAQPEMGCICTESGLGYTWVANSGENRLTPWRGDPVRDEPAEVLYLRDEETADVWTPTPRPTGADGGYEIRHGAGYTTYRHNSHGLEQRVRVFCDPAGPVKFVQLTLTNRWQSTRRITATYFVEWVLGVDRVRSIPHVLVDYDSASHTILAENRFSEFFGGRVAFLGGSEPPHGLTTDRLEFLGREGTYGRPDALRRIGLSGRVGVGVDPCAAYQIHLDLEGGATETVHFVLGQGKSRPDALRLARTSCRADASRKGWKRTRRFWHEALSAVQVRTPDPAFDLMMNRWLPYQIRSGRLWGRTGFYQSSGAFGYRDQLQDVLGVLDSTPHLAREHILLAAGHQFSEGDVLHWWHPVSEAGVRTRCSDDLVWLPYVTARYVERTGDGSILDEAVPFLEADPLRPGEHDRYGRFPPGREPSALYEHCVRALERASPLGSHGLPLIGSGDWNDGLDRVGLEGRGESVWLAWFLISALRAFAPICEAREESVRGQAMVRRAEQLTRAIEETAWDGDWYRRAYYDDGTPLGSSANLECRIDAVSQAWAVLSGAAAKDRQVRAMDSVHRLLIDPASLVLRLLDPPFDRTGRDPGYIKGYPPGVRENGAQYSHAAVWAGWAFSVLGDAGRAAEVFRMVSPVTRADSPEKVRTYRVEPYVVAADIYSGSGRDGQGGWTWYTGAAAWLYRLGLEQVLGLGRKGQHLSITPCAPEDWTGYELTLRLEGRRHEIHVQRDSNTGRFRVELNDG